MDHRFQNGLDDEREASPILNNWYETSFRDLLSIIDVTSDPFFQRAGIDKFLVFKYPDVPRLVYFSIDEKARAKPYEDILAEIWSKKEKEIPGWVWTSKADFVVYAFVINKELVENPLFIPVVDFIAVLKKHSKECREKKTKTRISETESWTTIFKLIPKEYLPSKPPFQMKLEAFLRVEVPDWKVLLENVIQNEEEMKRGKRKKGKGRKKS